MNTLAPLCRLALLSVAMLTLTACAGGSRKGVIGPQNLEFKTVYDPPAGLTIEAIHAAMSIGGSTATIFSYTEAGSRQLAWLIETAPGSGAGGLQNLPGPWTFDEHFDIQISMVGQRWLTLAIRSGGELRVGVITILPSTSPQFLVSDFSTVASGAPGAIQDFRLLGDQDSAAGWIGWTELVPADGSTPIGRRFRTVRLADITSGEPAIQPEYTSPTVNVDEPLTLDSVSSWDGQLIGGYLESGTGVPTWILGRLDAGTGLPLSTPAAIQWNGTDLDDPLDNAGLFAAAHPEEEQFAAPPTVEPCPGKDGFAFADSWLTSWRNTARVAVVEVLERKFNCPTDAEQLLFEGTSWVLSGLNRDPRRFTDEPPIVLVEGGTRQRLFVAHPDINGIEVLRSENLTKITTIVFDETRLPAGLHIDALHANGREEFSQLRVLGHTADGIFIAERSVGSISQE